MKPDYGLGALFCRMALALIRPTGLGASFLPDGANAYPAYGVVPLFCRMALVLIRPTGLGASFLPDGAGAYPAYGDRRRL